MMDMQEIDKMPAGREIDALIAEHIMGGKWLRFCDAGYPDPDSGDGRVHASIVLPKDFGFLCPPDHVEDTGECPRDRYGWIPRYSTDIAAAWEVVEKLRAEGKYFSIQTNTVYDVTFWDGNEGTWTRDGCSDKFLVDVRANSAPLAICRAALKAIMEDNND